MKNFNINYLHIAKLWINVWNVCMSPSQGKVAKFSIVAEFPWLLGLTVTLIYNWKNLLPNTIYNCFSNIVYTYVVKKKILKIFVIM